MTPTNLKIMIMILIIFEILFYYIIGFSLCFVISMIIIYYILSIYGVIGSPIIFQKYFPESICYLKEYKNCDKNAFDEINNFKSDNRIKLINYAIIEIYKSVSNSFDEENLKYIGFYRKINKRKNQDNKIKDDEFLEKENFKRYYIPENRCLFTYWCYFNNIAKKLGIYKVYKLIRKKLKSDNFRNAFLIPEYRMKIHIKIYGELYNSQSIDFYFPITEKFPLYKDSELIEIV